MSGPLPSLGAMPAAASLTLIQDIHNHHEAQRDIQSILQKLQRKKGRTLRIGLEGAAGSFDFAALRDFPEPHLGEEIARQLFEEGLVSGPVLEGFLNGQLQLVGVENPALYRKNVAAYQGAVPVQTQFQNQIQAEQNKLQNQKESVFPAPLKKLDAAMKAYHSGRMALGDYLRVVAEEASQNGFETEIFLAARDMERKLPFSEVEKERRAFVAELASAFGPKEAAWVKRWSASVQEEEVQPSRRFESLLQAAEAKGIAPRKFPRLLDYIRYLKLSEGINSEKLLEELKRMEMEAVLKLADGSTLFLDLMKKTKMLFLLEKLSRFELSPDEWRELENTLKDSPSLVKIPAPFKDFYRIAEDRNRALAEGALAANADVIVIGGFHSAGISQFLKSRGRLVSVQRPKITRIESEDGTSYLSVFAAEKTPLEKLFLRWKLFLAPPASFGIAPLVETTAGSAESRFATLYEMRGRPENKERIRAAATRLAGRVRPPSWLTETLVFSGPIAIALGLNSPAFTFLSVFLSPLLLTVAHYHIDKKLAPADRYLRWTDRLIWGTAFVWAQFLFFMVVLNIDGLSAAGLSLLGPALLHWTNHHAMNNPNSFFASFLFRWINLPPVLMSADEGEQLRSIDITAELRPFADEAKKDLMAAIAEWRSEPGYATKPLDESDAVVRLFDLYCQKAVGLELARVAAYCHGLAEAIRDSHFNQQELFFRLTRDQVWSFARSFSLPEKQMIRMRGVINTTYGAYLEMVPAEKRLLANTAAEQAIQWSTRKVMKDALAKWKKSVQETGDLSKGHEPVLAVFHYHANESLELQDPHTKLLANAFVLALAEADFSPEEAQARAMFDIADAVSGEEHEYSSRLPDVIYHALEETYEKSDKPRHAQAVRKGVFLGVQEAAYRDVRAVIQEWRTSAPNKPLNQRIPMSTNVKYKRYWGMVLATNDDLVNEIRQGFVRAFRESHVSPEEFLELAAGDVIFTMSTWIGQNRRELLEFAHSYYGILATDSSLDSDQQAQIKKGLRDGFILGAAEAVRYEMEKTKEATAAGKKPVAWLDGLKQKLDDEAAKRGYADADILEGMVKGHMELDFTPDDYLRQMSLDFDEAFGLAIKRPDPVSMVGFVHRLYRQVAEKKPGEVAATIKFSLSHFPDASPNYDVVLRGWRGETRNGVDFDKLQENGFLAPLARFHSSTRALDGEEYDRLIKGMQNVITEAHLTPEEISIRAHRDFTFLLQLWSYRPVDPLMAGYMFKKVDKDFTAFMDWYLPLVTRYKEEDKPVHAKAILEGVATAFANFNDKIGNDIARRFAILRPMINFAEFCRKSGFPGPAAIVMENASSQMAPGFDAPYFLREIFEQWAEAQKESEHYIGAVKSYEFLTSVLWSELTNDVHHKDQWANFVQHIYDLAVMKVRINHYPPAIAYLDYALNILEKRPELSALLPPRYEKKMRALRAAGLMSSENNNDLLRERMALIEEGYGSELDDPSLDEEQRKFELDIVFDSAIQACRTGDKRYLDRVLELESRNFGPEDGLRRLLNLATAHRFYGLAIGEGPESDQLKKEATELLDPGSMIKRIPDADQESLALQIYALHLAWLGQREEALGVLKKIIDHVSEEVKKEDRLPSTAEGRLLRISYINMAVLQSGMGESEAVARTADYILKAYDTPVRLDPLIENLAGVTEYQLMNPAVMLQAADLIVMNKGKDGAPAEIRQEVIDYIRQLQPPGYEEKMAVWSAKAGSLGIRKYFQALKPEINSEIGQGMPWPGLKRYREMFEDQLKYFEMRFNDSFEGLESSRESAQSWTSNRFASIRYQIGASATFFALMKMPEESLKLLRLAKSMGQRGVRRIASNVVLRTDPEDQALIAYPQVMGNPVMAIQESYNHLRDQSHHSLVAFGPLAVRVSSLLVDEVWKANKSLAPIISQLTRIMEPMLNNEEIHPGVSIVLSQFYDYLGQTKKAYQTIQKAAIEYQSKSVASRLDHSRAILHYITHVMVDPSLSLGKRLLWAEELTALAKKIDSSNIMMNNNYLFIVDLIRYQNDRQKLLELKELAQELIARTSRPEMAILLGTGFPMHLAELAIFLGRDTAEGKEVVGWIEGFRDWWGEPVEFTVRLALKWVETVDHPSEFLDWYERQDHSILNPTEKGLWMMAARYRAGQPDKAVEAFRGIIRDKYPHIHEEHHFRVVALAISESSIMRSIFIPMVRTVLNRFDPAEWEAAPIELKGFLTVAARVGDAEFLYGFDRLVENKKFQGKVRNALLGENGLIAEMEHSLTGEEWIERVNRMGPLTDAEVKRLGERAFNLAEMDEPTKNRFMNALIRKSEAHDLNAQMEVALAEATEFYNALDFNRARAALDRIPKDSWSLEFHRLTDMINGAEAAWSLYQSGQESEALEKTEVLPDDSATKRLKGRLTVAATMGKLLSEHRPQLVVSPQMDVPKIGVEDNRMNHLRQQAEKALAEAATSLEKVKSAVNELSKEDALLMTVEREAPLVLTWDADHREMFATLFQTSKELINRKKFKLVQDLMRVIFKFSPLFDPKWTGYEQCASIRNQIEQTRMLARALEVREWLEAQALLLRLKLEAVSKLEEESDSSGTLKGKTYHFFKEDWTLTDGGILVMEALYSPEVDAKDKEHTIRQLKKEQADAVGAKSLQRVDTEKLTDWQSGLNFQFSFGTEESKVRIPMTFVKIDRSGGYFRFVFLPDAHGAEILRTMEHAGSHLPGTLIHVSDMSLLAQVSAMDRSLEYLDTQIRALSDGRVPSEARAILNRLFGLTISKQPVLEDGVLSIEPSIHHDASQTEAVLSVLHPEAQVVAIQGPPGTGKTTTSAEIVRLLIQPRDSKPGRIVVLTSQAHAGVDNLAIRLRELNVPIIRSASDSSESKVAKELKKNHADRLRLLMLAIETHAQTGQGFAYLATNNGLTGDRKCFELLRLYLGGAPMSEIYSRFEFFTKGQNGNGNGNGGHRKQGAAQSASDGITRQKIRPVWGQEEAGQADAAETLIPYFAVGPDKVFLFGDQRQLPPHGLDDAVESMIRKAAQKKLLDMAPKDLNNLFYRARRSMGISLFEMAYDYSSKWETESTGRMAGGGVVTRMLRLARRSHWFITEMVNIFYHGLLQHRDGKKDPSKWEKITNDTVLIVNSPHGREESDHSSLERGDDTGAEKSASKRNFQEAGEVVRSVAYHLNSRSVITTEPRDPRDILILTPYKAQHRLINETLRIVAVLNDLKQNEDISFDELSEIKELILRHVAVDGKKTRSNINKGRIENYFRDLERGRGRNRAVIVGDLFEALKPLYNLEFDGPREITRADLPSLLVKTGGDGEDEGLDAQKLNVLKANTVHSVQGQERDVVVVSLVRSNHLGFLSGEQGERILNVAFSRPKEKIVIIYSNNMRPPLLTAIQRRLKEIHPSFRVWDRAPVKRTLGSLRAAWDVSFGNPQWDAWLDRWAAPLWESALFLSVLAYGLLTQQAAWITIGVAVKAAVFPLLHFIPSQLGISEPRAFGAEVLFAGGATIAFVGLWAILIFGVGASVGWSTGLAFVAPVTLHYYRNTWPRGKSPSSRILFERETPIVRDQAVESLGGLSPVSAAYVNQLIPAASSVRLPAEGGAKYRRRALSGA